jgi:predicted enzyme related to lactoylglutathione lyase
LRRAVEFYRDVLGLEVSDVSDSEFFVHAGSGTRILVYKRARTVAEHTVLTFPVENLRAVVDEIRGRGVNFEDYDMPGLVTHDGIAEDERSLGAWFLDTEGNIISLMQMK